MIYKELDPFESKANEKMAYYLRRAFAGSEDVDVLNGLVVRSGEVRAQMHHLVMHPFGLIVVENLAVRGTINIEADWQWTQLHRGEHKQIRSPVTETKLQALQLEAFLDKKVRQKGFFHSLELDVLVAVPDLRAIKWPQSGPLLEVCNADQVPEQVLRRLFQCKIEAKRPGKLVGAQRQRLAQFLCASHKVLPRLVTVEEEQSTRSGEFGTTSGAQWSASSRASDLG